MQTGAFGARSELPEALMTTAERLARTVLLFHRGGEWTRTTAPNGRCNLAPEVLADGRAKRRPGDR
jgi:hypothetical protein